MPKSLDLIVGIMLTLTGVYCFVCLPIARKRYGELRTAGKVTDEEVGKKIKMLKVAGIGSLVGGICLICTYVFGLY